jgi:tRNA(His) 5'-end guanylyltransferase
MPDKTNIAKRMKSYYEKRNQSYLIRRMPVIIRLDGKAFHTYTKNFIRPFDKKLQNNMIDTTKFLMENIQNAKLGYTQSDEISILLIDYVKLNTDAWFDNNVQKMTSVSASLCTGIFNYNMADFMNISNKIAFFDSRVFNIPESDMINYFIWRQQDCIKNSISSLAQYYFSNKELYKKNSTMMIDMLKEKEIYWSALSNESKYGCFVYNNGNNIISDKYTYDTLDDLIKNLLKENNV